MVTTIKMFQTSQDINFNYGANKIGLNDFWVKKMNQIDIISFIYDKI